MTIEAVPRSSKKFLLRTELTAQVPSLRQPAEERKDERVMVTPSLSEPESWERALPGLTIHVLFEQIQGSFPLITLFSPYLSKIISFPSFGQRERT